MEVINILLSEERVNVLREVGVIHAKHTFTLFIQVNMSGNNILDNINKLSRVMALAVIGGNNKISTDYKYSGDNLCKCNV